MLDLQNMKHLDKGNFFLIAGPCVIENQDMPFNIAEKIKSLSDALQIPFIFKASYKKANRSKLDSFSGIGDIMGLEILKAIKDRLDIPVLTDIHSEQEAEMAAPYVDILQIPAFLCRQTELLVAAAKTNKAINIKKGQFLSAASMQFALDKVIQSGNKNVMLTERGNMFGYGDLVVDIRNIALMKNLNVPVVLDITHSLQQPNQVRGVTGGQPKMIETIAKAGIAAGADGIFLETHPNPSEALSDGANMLQLEKLESLVRKLLKIHAACKS